MMGNIPLTKGEQKDVDIINRAMKRLISRGITFHCMDEAVCLLRGDKGTPVLIQPNGHHLNTSEGMPDQDAIIGELDAVCEAGGW